MCGREVRRTLLLYIAVLLILFIIQVTPFKGPFMGIVSASSSWVQTTEPDFNNGTLTNVTVIPSGEVKLASQTKYIEDDFVDESKISNKNNVIVDTAIGEARLVKIAKTFGGGLDDGGWSVQQTSDGGYIITGRTDSYGAGWGDVWLIKTDGTGIEQWSKTFGGVFDDESYSVQQTSDGGYIITGATESYGAGDFDVWLIKTNELGDKQWDRTFGGGFLDGGFSVQQTSDGGYIITAITESYGAGDFDVWLIKTNGLGYEEWNKTFGGVPSDIGSSGQQTSDDGYIITGYTESYGAGGADIWMIKTNRTGYEEWNRTFGGSNPDIGWSVQQTLDSGYIIAGTTASYGAGGADVLLIKTDGAGIEQWSKTFGGVSGDEGYSAQQTSDGGYIITGATQSYGAGDFDVWLIKTTGTGNEEWNKTFGGVPSDAGLSVQQTSDDGYIITGYTESYGSGGLDVSLIKTNESGCVPYIYGELTSVNLLAGQVAVKIENFTYSASIPPDTEIKIQFSQNMIEWYSLNGTLNYWDGLSDGNNSFPLAQLNWASSNFYYRMAFTSDNIEAQSIQNINLSYSQYLLIGTLESQPFDAGAGVNWTIISWTKAQPTDDIKFQLKSASTQPGLSSEDFVGPNGAIDTYYDTSGAIIWLGHDSDQWAQYKVYLSTTDKRYTPILEDVTIFYNHIPLEPELVSPTDNSITNDSTPMFNWNFLDQDGTQGGFQVLIDDDNGFMSVNYDSGQQSTSNQYWQFPTGTGFTTISDGTWYWKVKTQDNDGDWGPNSSSYIVTIDTISPSIESRSPIGANDPINTTIKVTFSKAMDHTSTENAFFISPSVSGTFDWDGNSLTFMPGMDLNYGTEYSITIGSGAKDLAGNNLVPSSWKFTTISGGIGGPGVEEYEPKGADIPVTDIEIRILFSQNMNHKATEDAFSIEPYVDFVPTWFGRTLIITPTKPLDYNTKYTITISVNATNVNGEHLSQEHEWYFFTEKEPEDEGTSFWETWEPIITALTILMSIIIFLVGALTVRKKRGKLRLYMEKIDEIYNEYKKNYQICEKELITLRESLKKEVEGGKLVDSHFLILDKKIDEYMQEMKAQKNGFEKAESKEEATESGMVVWEDEK